MTVLTRYIIRSHLGPLLFTFSLLSGLLWLSVIAERLDDLAGKGLPKEVILEALVLYLPHTIALTLPMAVLPAVLYTFSELAANSEIVAMSGGGVRPRKLFLPAMFLGVVLTGITFLFNDRVLPEANHRLKNLHISIGQKDPTFQLRERVVNVITGEGGLGPFYLRAGAVDRASSELTDVVIHDMSRQGIRRTTYASRGEMRMNDSFTDLQLRLYDGRVYEVRDGKRAGFRQTAFDRQVNVLRGVGDIFEDADAGYRRSDREMPVAMLLDSANRRLAQLDSIREESRDGSLEVVRRALGGDSAADRPGRYSKDPSGFAGARLPADETTRMAAIDAHTRETRFGSLRRQANRYGVEIHKKLVIASACMVFVLIGMPVGVRFPRGGVSMVIVVSALVIGVFQYGLSTGEDWADRNLATPFWSMWSPSLAFILIGALQATRIGRWTASARDSGWRELWLELRSWARRLGAGRPGSPSR
ncbi:MAG: LptF/LptG family permease [Gemmatimonadota bacterium]|nr:LptF/LptG family permease [Gemmatimonadota bacterium]